MEQVEVASSLPVAGSNGRRALRKVRSCVVHHDGEFASPGYVHLDRYRAQATYHINRGWNRLSYHWKIARDGTLYATCPPREVLWHAGNYKINLESVAVCLDGDLTRQKPTAGQVGTLWGLLLHLTTERPDMPELLAPTVYGHREVKRNGTTECPGDTVMGLVEAFRRLG